MRSLAGAVALCTLTILACAGCGKSTTYRAVAQSSQVGTNAAVSPMPTQSLPSPTAATGGHPATSNPAKIPGPTPSASAGYPQYAGGTTPAPATVTLASSCVVPGGKQTLSIVSEPNFVVGYDAQYADGRDGRTYGGMDSNGRIDSKGYYSSTWIVAATAPVGQVIVWVAVGGSGETAFRQPTFQVKTSC